MQTTFSSERIIVRPYKASDAPSLFTAIRESVATVGPWLPWCHADYSLVDAKQWITTCERWWAEKTEYPFVVIDTRTNEILGGTGINQINKSHNFGNIGYWVRASRVRNGIATSAVQLVANFGFQELKLSRLEIVALLGNTASRRVAEKAGATFECIARNRLIARGQAHDAALYSLTPNG